jgi:hypothetical protein
LIDGYFTASLPAQGYGELSVLDALRQIGADILDRHCPMIHAVEDTTIVRRVERKADAELETVETPVGALKTDRILNEAKHTDYIRKYPIETLGDLKVYEYVVEHTHYEADFAPFHERTSQIGDDGITTPNGPMTPLLYFIEHLCGIEKTIYLLADHPEEVEACFDLMHAQNKAVYRLLSESPAEVIIDYEDTSSTLISPRYYREYCAPLIDEYAAICHDGGKTYITHMCGKLRAFSDQIRQGQQDGVDSVCPPSTGDTWAHEARDAWGPEKIIIGGLEPPALERMSVRETREHVVRVLDQMPTFRRFILSTGDATSYGTPMENLRTITHLVEDYAWK